MDAVHLQSRIVSGAATVQFLPDFQMISVPVYHTESDDSTGDP